MKKVLLVSNHDSFSNQIARWAQIIKSDGDWEPVICITANYMDRHMDICRSKGITVLPLIIASSNTAQGPVDSPSTLWQKIKKVLRCIPGVKCLAGIWRLISDSISNMRFFTQQIRLMRHLIRQEHIDALLILESSCVYGASLYIEAAHREGLVVLTNPFEKGTVNGLAEQYSCVPQLSLKRPINRLIGLFYPHWVKAHNNIKMVRIIPEQLLALEWLGLAPARPWELVGNKEDMIAVDSQSTFDFYKEHGLNPERMRVIGRPEHDMMKQILQDPNGLREKLYKSLGLPADRPMILSALVQEHNISGRPECDFREYEKMIEFWVKSLGAINNHNVIISLHPWHTNQTDTHKWDYIEQWGVKICREDLASLIPLCDIFVAAGSSTIQWAIACGKPVINYNVYRYDRINYRDTPGVLEVQEQKDFLQALRRLTAEPAYFSKVKQEQEDCSEYWGQVDGKAAKRLMGLFDQLIQ